MEEKLIFCERDHVHHVNGELKEGWSIKTITPVGFSGHEGQFGIGKDGFYGAYVVLQREKK